MKSLAIILMAGILSGCATLSTVKDAKGQGHSRVYRASYDEVWSSLPLAMANLGLKVLTAEKDHGRILSETAVFRPLVPSTGEVVAVFVDRIDDTSTKVEVVSRKRIATNILAFSYQDRILNELDRVLGSNA